MRLLALCIFLAACDKAPKEPESKPPVAQPVALVKLPERLTRAAPERVVAIGDLHGDLEAVRKAFRLAGAVDANDAWVGGKLVVVQTGDTVDRGDDDRRILDWLERIQGSAKAAGGEVILLLGNHELMNVAGDFRYVTPGGFSAFAGPTADSHAAAFPEAQRGRASAFAPGGPYAKKLADSHLLFVRVGRSVFVHGGILPKHVRAGLADADAAVHGWLLGGTQSPPDVVMGEDGMVWTRSLSDGAPKDANCKELAEVLARLEADRIVMGHTVQTAGITNACEGKAWRIDTGMSRFYRGPISALEIRGAEVTPLRQ